MKRHSASLKYGWIAAGFLVWAALPLFDRRKRMPSRVRPTPHPAVADVFVVRNLPADIALDQLAIFAAPAHLRRADLRWLLPAAAVIALSIAFDRPIMQWLVPRDQRLRHASLDISNAVINSLFAAPLLLFAIGNLRGDEPAREAGFVGGEAILDAFLLDELLKVLSWRERPNRDRERGLFFHRDAGINSSFLSTHSMLSWTCASVLAHEHPTPAVRVSVYLAAGTVSVTRVLAQQHFPTDVLLGGTVGWFLGRYVFRARHRILPG